jgi:SAM-dependent methyltransferase
MAPPGPGHSLHVIDSPERGLLAAAVIDLSTAIVHSSATASSGARLDIVTAPVPWGYALIVPLPPPPAGRSAAVAIVSVGINVTAGHVGVGVLNVEENAFLVERQVVAAPEDTTLRFSLSVERGLGPLVFRNGDVPASSRFSVQRIELAWRTDATWDVRVSPRDLVSEDRPADGDVRVFDDTAARRLNEARSWLIDHIRLPLDGARVLDAGCGVGHFIHYYESRGCEIVGVDGRSENIAEVQRRHPAVRAVVGDVENYDLTQLGRFDIVHCLGLLYHLENPIAALRNLKHVCDGLLVLETMVMDAASPVMTLADETKTVNQALRGIGCRPSPAFVVMALNRIGYRHVYGAEAAGIHEDFDFEWRNDGSYIRDDHPLRCLFVASHAPFHSPCLVSLAE